MLVCYENLVKVFVLITTLFCYRYNCYEISNKHPETKLPSKQFESILDDQVNYHPYRRFDQHELFNQQQGRIALNAIPKSRKYDGWKPIVSSRRLQTQTPSEKYSQYSGSSVVESSSSVSNVNRMTDTTTEQPSSRVPIRQPQKAKHRTIKEDDIMRMHYGADDEYEYQKEKLSSSMESELNKNNLNEKEIESKKQFKFHSQYRLNNSTRQHPKNIHEIMLGNSPPTFKPIVQNTPYSSPWERNFDVSLTTETRLSADYEDASLKSHNTVIYSGTDNKSHVGSGKENEQVVKIDPSYTQMDRKSTFKQLEPTKETSVENEYDSGSGSWLSSYFGKQNPTEKGGKFLGKPIVIAEQTEPFPYFTAEYYRKLFDSIGRQDRSVDSEFSNKTDSTTNTTAVDNRTDIKSVNCTADQITCNKLNSKHENRVSHRHRHRYQFNIFKFMGINMNDLLPKTLRSNIYLIKKLLTQCYTELQDEDPSPIVCLKKITTKVLDNAIDKDVIKLTDNVSLIKENVTAIAEFQSSRSDSSSTDWLPSTVDKLAKLFLTHSLRVQLVNSQEDHKFQIEGRRRHYFRRVFPVIAGVYLFITAVLIPIVFQLMAMMGGKSFVISKIALIFAVLSSVSKFLIGGDSPHPHHHHHSPPPSYYPPPPHRPPPETPTYYEHPSQQWKKSDKRFKRVPINYSYYTVEKRKYN